MQNLVKIKTNKKLSHLIKCYVRDKEVTKDAFISTMERDINVFMHNLIKK